MRIYHRGNPPSASIHEEATTNTVMPFQVVYNNLVEFDPKKPLNSIDTIVPDLATKWSWDDSKTKLTFSCARASNGMMASHSRAKDVKCTWDMLLGKSKQRLRKNPRSIWYHNLRAYPSTATPRSPST